MCRKTQIKWLLVLIILITPAAFSPGLGGDFLNWDDEENVVFKEEIRRFIPEDPFWYFTDFTVGDFKPLAWFTYSVDHLFWGLNPFGYHFANLLFHALSAAVIFLLLIKLSSIFSKGEPGRGRFVLPAFFAALFFSLHPLRAESVAWISERKDVLCCFFYLAAVLAYLRYLGGRKSGWYILALLFALGALLSKAMAVTLPLILILIDLSLKRYRARPVLLSAKQWLDKIPFFILALASGSAALGGQLANRALLSLQRIGAGGRAVIFLKSLIFYLEKIVFPLRPAAAYPPGAVLETGITITAVALVIFLLVPLAAAGLLWRRRKPAFLIGLAWFVITVLPVSGILPTGLVLVSDRFTYLPSAGIAGLFFLGLAAAGKKWGSRAVLFPGLAAALILFFLCFRQVDSWTDSERLWKETVEKYPDSPVARAHLGQLLYQRGADEEAVEHLRAAVALVEENPLLRGDILFAARSNLGRALGRLGNLEEAKAVFEDILNKRDSWVIRHSLGGIYAKLGRKEEALAEYRAVIRERPGFAPALCEYGLLLAQSGETSGAIEVYRRLLQIEPRSPRGRYNLSLAFMDRGQWEKAIGLLQELSAEYPDNSRLAAALEIALRAAGRTEEADLLCASMEGKSSPSSAELPYAVGSRAGILYPL